MIMIIMIIKQLKIFVFFDAYAGLYMLLLLHVNHHPASRASFCLLE